MTRDFTLLKFDNHYGYEAKVVHGTSYKLVRRLILCNTIVNRLVGECEKIVVSISDEPTDGQRVLVHKQGYFRWDWSIPEWNTGGGMFREAEENLHRIFSDQSDDGLNPVMELWLTITKK
jgi:hypothetical protein